MYRATSRHRSSVLDDVRGIAHENESHCPNLREYEEAGPTASTVHIPSFSGRHLLVFDSRAITPLAIVARLRTALRRHDRLRASDYSQVPYE